MTEKKDAAPVAANEVHTYEDGTQVVGSPPFPAKSPREAVSAIEPESPTPMHVPHGVKTSGAPAPTPAGTTHEQFVQRVGQQLKADVASGKDPETPNPTTSSDKPQLANVVTADQLESAVQAGPTIEDLHAVGKEVKGSGDFTQEQVDAAVTQIARETPGPIPAKETKATKATAKKGAK